MHIHSDLPMHKFAKLQRLGFCVFSCLVLDKYFSLSQIVCYHWATTKHNRHIKQWKKQQPYAPDIIEFKQIDDSSICSVHDVMYLEPAANKSRRKTKRNRRSNGNIPSKPDDLHVSNIFCLFVSLPCQICISFCLSAHFSSFQNWLGKYLLQRFLYFFWQSTTSRNYLCMFALKRVFFFISLPSFVCLFVRFYTALHWPLSIVNSKHSKIRFGSQLWGFP